MTKTREELEKIIADAQAELNRMDEKLVIFDGWVPKRGEKYHVPTLEKFSASVGRIKTEIDYGDVKFQTPEQAAAVSDAICVMLELRNQPGAFKCREDANQDGYIAMLDCNYSLMFGLETEFYIPVCPCFPSKHECEKAVDAVGRERVERALKLWAGVPL